MHKGWNHGKNNAEKMQFWTKAEFEQFIAAVQDKPASYTAFKTMYYTGMRAGELCALTLADVDLENITINKTFQRINGKDVVWAPKTPKSNWVIKHFLNHKMLRGCKKSSVKKVRVYNLRHSHASFLSLKQFAFFV